LKITRLKESEREIGKKEERRKTKEKRKEKEKRVKNSR